MTSPCSSAVSNFENIDIDVNIGIFSSLIERGGKKRDKKKRETRKLGEREKFKDNRIIGEDRGWMEWKEERKKKEIKRMDRSRRNIIKGIWKEKKEKRKNKQL